MKRGTKTFLIWCVLLGVVFVALFNRSDPEVSFISVKAALELIEQGQISAYRTADDVVLLVTPAGAMLALPAPMGGRPRLANTRVLWINTSPWVHALLS